VGATATPQVVQLTGLASLVAGAASMAVGEYISMRAQVDLFERLLEEEREAIRTDPQRERAILQATLVPAGGAAIAIGALLGKSTKGRCLRSAMRQLLVVALASGFTFLVGKFFGAAIS